jgi:hypothetical protein
VASCSLLERRSLKIDAIFIFNFHIVVILAAMLQ